MSASPKRHAPPASRLSGRRIPSLAALLFIVCVLLVVNLSNWRLLVLFRRSLEADLVERLSYISLMIAREVRTPRLPVLVDLVQDRTADEAADLLIDLGDTAAMTDLCDRLAALERVNQLDRVELVTTHGLVIADSRRRSPPGDPYVFADIDRVQMDEARAGRTAHSPLYYVEGKPYKRYYLPFTDGQSATAILSVSASAEYVSQAEIMRNRVRLQSIVTSGLLLLIGVSIFRLFSYLVRVERSAMQGARVEAMSALAAGVAHEVRNPLSIIRMLGEEIVSESSDNPRITANARDIMAETERLNELLGQFLSLSRAPEAAGDETVDLVHEIGRVVELLRKGASEKVAFVAELPDRPVHVAANERVLRQVLLNLVINAQEALPPDGGTVRITLAERRGMAEIHVVDTGTGMSKRELARVFEPFYTTKTMGTGLGLPISRSIVEMLGGTIGIASAPGRGTDILIRLPLRTPGTGNAPQG